MEEFNLKKIKIKEKNHDDDVDNNFQLEFILRLIVRYSGLDHLHETDKIVLDFYTRCFTFERTRKFVI